MESTWKISFKGKTAVSTGAASGMGLLFAQNFAALGVNMWLCFSEYDETTYAGPPLLSNVLKIKQGLKL